MRLRPCTVQIHLLHTHNADSRISQPKLCLTTLCRCLHTARLAACVNLLVSLSQVIAPRVKAYLYTWGPPRYTAEGDRIPAKIENLDIGYIDGMLLLPLVEEHNIDERSPLCGHTHETLMSVSFATALASCKRSIK